MTQTSYDALELLNAREKRLQGWAYKLIEQGNQFGLDTMILGELDLDEGQMAVTIPYASGVRRDGVGDLLEVGGIDLSRHRLNPICLFDHAKQVQLPIAMTAERDGDRYDFSKYTIILDPIEKVAKAKCFFYGGKGMGSGNSYGNPATKTQVGKDAEYSHALFCEQLYDMLAKRLLNGGSIGYQVVKAIQLSPDYDTGIPQGLHLLKTLQLEVSVVVLPANMDTVRKTLSDGVLCGKSLSPVLVKSLSPYCGPKKAQLGYEGKSRVVPLSRKTKIPPARWKPGLGAIKQLRLKYKKKALLSDKADVSPQKARRILKDDEVQGHKLTSKQRGMFGAISGQDKKHLKALRHKYKRRKPLEEVEPARKSELDPKGKPKKGIKSLRKDMSGGDLSGDVARANARVGPTGTAPKPKKPVALKPAVRNAISSRRSATIHPSSSSAYQAAHETGTPVKLEHPPELGKSVSGPHKKGLQVLRKKYRRPAKVFRKRLRRSSPGSSLVYMSGKDLSAARKLCQQKGVKLHHLGSHQSGHERVKLSGDDLAIDEIAREYGKLFKAIKRTNSIRR